MTGAGTSKLRNSNVSRSKSTPRKCSSLVRSREQPSRADSASTSESFTSSSGISRCSRSRCAMRSAMPCRTGISSCCTVGGVRSRASWSRFRIRETTSTTSSKSSAKSKRTLASTATSCVVCGHRNNKVSGIPLRVFRALRLSTCYSQRAGVRRVPCQRTFFAPELSFASWSHFSSRRHIEQMHC